MHLYRVLAIAAFLGACTGSSGGSEPGAPEPSLTREELLDPETCKGCHPQHYREWASSMHAYAAEDPVFVAMNRRGQRETGGQLGDFCVRCHAPMALREGKSADGLQLDQLPGKLRGVTCYFCHNTIAVGDAFNNHLELANDTTLRGAISDPVPNGAHASAYSSFQDRNHSDSTRLCGGCHDVVTPSGVHLERTFAEYQESMFAKAGPGFDTCSGCHMPGRPGAVALGVDARAGARERNDAQAGARQRTRHEHLWPGVDTALTAFPDREVQQRAVECELSSSARIYEVVQDGLGGLKVRLETFAGHHQPSGSALDRRLWLELSAYDESGAVVFASGRIEDGELEQKPAGSAGFDPQLALFRNWIYDAQGREVHMFWEASPSAAYPEGYASLTLPPQLTPLAPHTLEASYQIPNFARVARIQLQLRMRAVGLDVLQDLVASGDLDQAMLGRMPTFTLYGAAVDYDPRTRVSTSRWPAQLVCPENYRCLLEPESCAPSGP